MAERPRSVDLWRRLRAIYCRHRGMTYDDFDRLALAGRISFGEVLELVEVLFTELQHAGLYEYLFREEVRARNAAAAEREGLIAQAKRLQAMRGDADPATRAALEAALEQLRERLR